MYLGIHRKDPARAPIVLRRALILGLVMSLLTAGMALADNVQNDVTAGGNDTFAVGGSTTISYRIVANSGDGQSGCNASDGSPAVVTINTPAGVIVSPNPLSISACSTFLPTTFTASAAGNYDITVSVSDSGTGTYNTNPAKFTLRVLAPSDTTPPVINPNVSGTPGTNGWYTSDVTVSWEVTDPESEISSSSGCGSTTISTDTAGTTLTCWATSAGGTISQSVTIKRDATAPTISGSPSPAPNANGWNNTNVSVSFTCSDTLSGIASCGPDQTLSAEGAHQSAAGTAVDSAGNSASTTVGGIKIDKTAPTVSASVSPKPNANGWHNTDVTVSFGGSDTLSGIDSCDAPVVLSSEGVGQSASGSCTDNAGNESASATASGINIDKTPPSVSLVGGPANGGSYYFGFVPVKPTCTASDSLSGVNGQCVVSGYADGVGNHTVEASATDFAGNEGSSAASYTVLAWTLNGFYRPVDMGGILNTVKGGSTVPLKFQVFAGSTELTSTTAIKALSSKQVSCDAGSATDAIEEFAPAGETMLRYDATGGQFIYNWKTPKTPGKCYEVTLTTQDGSFLKALFGTK